MAGNNSAAVELRPAAVPDRIGQATAVEQSRAVAEVMAAVEVAQRMPRNVEMAKAEMRRACDEYALASRAFYRFKRGGTTVSGASIHLARELARCWGNIDYGIAELRRDEVAGQSEMKAWAWDQQTNARPSTTFIVPHQRDSGGKRVPLETDRDIYENNANQGGRRVRQMIFAVLPVWLVEEAEDRCRATIEAGDGRPLEERIESAVERFAALGVTVERVEQRVGRPRAQWNARDLAELTVVHGSIRRGEVSVDDEFPPQRITVAEVAAAAAPPAPRVGERGPEPFTPAQPVTVTPASEGPPPAGDGGEMLGDKVEGDFHWPEDEPGPEAPASAPAPPAPPAPPDPVPVDEFEGQAPASDPPPADEGQAEADLGPVPPEAMPELEAHLLDTAKLLDAAKRAGHKNPRVAVLKLAQRLGHHVATIADLIADRAAFDAVLDNLLDR